MAINVCPVTPSFAAEIGDADLSRSLEPADLTAIRDAFTTYAVLIFPDQHLSQDQHLDFAKTFGPLETTIALYRKDASRPAIADNSCRSTSREVIVAARASSSVFRRLGVGWD
jgi:alpha-ketoglutarate-dependent 2,4-dichlorophenoxyacetate dioxygenase